MERGAVFAAISIALIAVAAGGCGDSANDDATNAIRAVDPDVVSCALAWREFAKTLDPEVADPKTGEMRPTTDVYKDNAIASERWNCTLARPRNGHRHWCYARGESGGMERLRFSGWPTDELYSGAPGC